jgi:hypothetical protein
MNLTSANAGTDLKNTPIVVCYPPGPGGSFLGACANNRDCFTLGEKLNRWFDKNTIDALFDFSREYQTVNKNLYPDAFDLLLR